MRLFQTLLEALESEALDLCWLLGSQVCASRGLLRRALDLLHADSSGKLLGNLPLSPRTHPGALPGPMTPVGTAQIPTCSAWTQNKLSGV